MTSRSFVFKTIIFSLSLLFCILIYAAYKNEYALFGTATGKRIDIYDNERRSKYLLSFNYIPMNFEGIIIGPSLSDNLNPALVPDLKLYNASINGGNISELKVLVENMFKNNRNIKFIIICVDPYITKDKGPKTEEMSLQNYIKHILSLNIVRDAELKANVLNGTTRDYFNEYGYYNFNLKKTELNPVEEFIQRRNKIDEQLYYVDPDAFRELKDVVSLAKKNNVKIFAYYYPRPYYPEKENLFRDYEKRTREIFDSNDTIIDFSGPNYFDFRTNPYNYSDGVHLSNAGAEIVIHAIGQEVREYYKPY